MDPKSLRYCSSHEWAGESNGLVTVGISKFAVEQLTDIVYLDLPNVGESVTAGESFGEIESVKAVSDLYAPVSGEVVEVNESILDDPAKLSDDPYETGWMIKIKPDNSAALGELMTFEQYEKQIAEEGN